MSNVRPESMARITTKELADAFIAEQIAEVPGMNSEVAGKVYEYFHKG